MGDRTLLRYGVINSGTFCLDLICLSTFRQALHWPVPVAVSGAYAIALTVSFTLNRGLNFHSHERLTRQVPTYIGVVAVNYLLFILTLTTVLSANGVDYRIARLLTGTGEALFMYVAMRFVVFRDVRPGMPAAVRTPVAPERRNAPRDG